MHRFLNVRWVIGLVLVMSGLVWLRSTRAASLDPKAITITLPKDIKWVATAGGSENAPALSSQRPFHHCPLGNVVGQYGRQVRSGGHGAASGGEFRQAQRKRNPLRRREGRRVRPGNRRHGARDVNAGRGEVASALSRRQFRRCFFPASSCDRCHECRCRRA